ncbi:MAG TPA: CPBP family intramembrane glutamic endopeptidase [Candidatus Limnocylindrales bacterium]|jgi:membrane protease YdiL (CAAX protease family)|nr:CPBP family intramembrane glutamic endopeptidase [Candidatus Limnocylindrales bacterium]
MRLYDRFVAGPAYPPEAADLRTVSVFGVDLPVRASVAIVVATLAILFDYSRTFIPDSIRDLGLGADGLRYQSIERLILFLLVPLAFVVLGFRDSPARYGLRLGDWRWGIGLIAVGALVMTPVVMFLAGLPDFRAYYAPSLAPVPDMLVTNAIDLISAEFILRGFLMFALIRVIGPIGVLVVQFPFVLAHLGKPEIELFSTLFGGFVYAWVDWRTGSILWSALAHIYIVTLLVVLSAA